MNHRFNGNAGLEGELDRLAALPEGWDSRGAKQIDRDILEAARGLIRDLPIRLDRAPAVVPLAGGSLQLEWHDGPRSLELEFETPDTIQFLKWHPDEGIEDEGVYPISDLDRSVELIRWFQQGAVNA
jgi:hypothetical protein